MKKNVKNRATWSLILVILLGMSILGNSFDQVLAQSILSDNVSKTSKISNFRGLNYEDIGFANGTHIWNGGLESWLLSNNGTYVPYEMSSNFTHIFFDSKQYPFAMNKNTCVVTVYDNDVKISQSPKIAINKDYWNYGYKNPLSSQYKIVDMSNAICTFNQITNSSGYFIQTIKSDSNVQLSVMYSKRINQKFETIVSIKQINPVLNGDMFEPVEKISKEHLNDITIEMNKTSPYIQTSLLGKNVSMINDNFSIQNDFNFKTKANKILYLDLSKTSKYFSNVKNTIYNGIQYATFEFGNNQSRLISGQSISLDPTWGYTSSTTDWSTATNNASCSGVDSGPFGDHLQNSGAPYAFDYISSAGVGNYCRTGEIIWDISTIPTSAIIQTINFNASQYYHSYVSSTVCNINSVSHPTSTLAYDNYNDGMLGTTYKTGTWCQSTDNTWVPETYDLGSAAVTNMKSNLGGSWGINFFNNPNQRGSFEQMVEFNNMRLQVSYTIPIPTAPVLNNANTQSSTGITPSWSASSGATFYLVKRASPAGTSFSQIANVSSLSYADSGLTPGDQYQYEIIAGNSSGTSSASNMKSNYTSNVAPTALSASLITYLSERTTWSNPTGNSSSFKIEDATGTCSSYSTVTSDTGNTTNKYDLTSLTGNTKVCVRVSTNYAKGTNSSGTSSPSSVLSFYTLPAPPTGLTVTQLVSKQAHLSWTAPSDNGTILGYFIEYSTNGGSTWNTAIANTGNSTTHFDHSGLTAGLTYTYRVSTIQYSGTSVPSGTASKLIFQGIIINAFESDGTTTFAGNIIQSNSTSKNNVFTLVQGTVGLNGLIGNQNFTVKDSNNFVVFKDYNFNATSTGSASYSTHIYRVDCPSTLAGNDIKLEVNDTDGQRISSFNTPTCDSNNLVTFGNVFTGNGNSALSYSSQLLVAILNSTFNANPVSFSMNSVPIGTSYNSATEVATSPSFVIGSGLQTFSETFSLQLNKVITLSGVGSIGGGGSVGYQSLGSSPVSPNNTSQLNTINPPRMTAKFATNPMTGKFGQLLNGTMTLTWQNSKNLIVNSISVGDYVRWIFYPNQPFNLIGDTIYQNSATAYVADIPFNVQIPQVSCQLNMTASLGCAENNNQYDIPVKLNISVNGQQYVISSTLSVIVSNSPVSNPIVAYSVIGVISVLVLIALFRTKGGKPKRTSKYSKNENDLGKSKTAKELDKVLKKKK